MTLATETFQGDVFVRDFDIGVFRTLETMVVGDRVFLEPTKVPGVKVPLYDENHGNEEEIGKRMPGIPVIFANPDDSVQRYNQPCIRIVREDPSPALERWMSEHYKTRGPAPGANAVQVTFGGRTFDGYDKYIEQKGSWPYDIPYTISVESAGLEARTEAQTLLRYIMKKFPPYALLKVLDSIGDERLYHAFVEGPSELSEVADIRHRSIVYALSLRVSGEFDLEDVNEYTPITQIVETLRTLEG